MFTLSQMVDEIVSETKRPDLVSEIVRYANQTIRDCHFSTDRNAAIFYRDNFYESLVTATAESGFSWTPNNPTTFQKMAGVKYPSEVTRLGEPIWAEETTPGRHLNELCHYYYQVGASFVFAGYGGLGAQIALGYFAFPPSLKYYSPAARLASYDPESGWSYLDGVDTEELQEAARLVSTNWLFLRWSDVISEGIRAKVYKRISDTERARNSYSLYGQLRQGLLSSETAVVSGII